VKYEFEGQQKTAGLFLGSDIYRENGNVEAIISAEIN
jgi:hypothetical protein